MFQLPDYAKFDGVPIWFKNASQCCCIINYCKLWSENITAQLLWRSIIIPIIDKYNISNLYYARLSDTWNVISKAYHAKVCFPPWSKLLLERWKWSVWDFATKPYFETSFGGITELCLLLATTMPPTLLFVVIICIKCGMKNPSSPHFILLSLSARFFPTQKINERRLQAKICLGWY